MWGGMAVHFNKGKYREHRQDKITYTDDDSGREKDDTLDVTNERFRRKRCEDQSDGAEGGGAGL